MAMASESFRASWRSARPSRDMRALEIGFLAKHQDFFVDTIIYTLIYYSIVYYNII